MQRNRRECGKFDCGYVMHMPADLIKTNFIVQHYIKNAISQGFPLIGGLDLHIPKSKISPVVGGKNKLTGIGIVSRPISAVYSACSQ